MISTRNNSKYQQHKFHEQSSNMCNQKNYFSQKLGLPFTTRFYSIKYFYADPVPDSALREEICE
jgi:hypothetical protein